MTDVIDQAQAFDALNIAQSLHVQEAIARNTVRPMATGYCLNVDCGEALDGDPARLFCGAACAQRHHEITHRGKR